MARIYMVRHGHAAAGFDNADPSLDGTGRGQAEEVARVLLQRGPLPIVTSPLARARETARPLALLWQREPVVDERVAEIPTPQHLSLTERVPWLRALMAGTWRGADRSLDAWRRSVIDFLTSVPTDTVIFSHFIAINVGVGYVANDDRVVVFAPDNCSITLFETNGTNLSVIERGREAATRVG